MRMRARPHLHYAPVPGGVYFSGAQTQFVMRGWDLLFTVADVCVPRLELGATEDDLVEALGSERARPVVRHLTTGLRDHGMLLDLEGLTEPEPPAEVRERHAEALAYLESVSDDPYAVFAKLRSATVLLYGPPEAVQPAQRGLTRAGIGTIVLASSADEARACQDVDAAIYCRVRDDGAELPDVPVVPVLLDDQVCVAGPVIASPAEHHVWPELTRRTLAWAKAEKLVSSARPVADALAGALAAQLLFEALSGLGTPGETHVVHGADLVADRIVIDSSATPDEGWRTLDDAASTPMPDAEDAVADAGALAGWWTGPFTAVTGEDLPQLPLALRQVDYRVDRSGSVVTWAPEQESAAVGAVLEALRRSSAGAAGLTEEHWLLDGALRLLTDGAEPLQDVAVEDMDPEAVRIWQSLERHDAEPLTVRLRHVPGLDWCLGQVESATGEVLAQSWNVDAAHAVSDALGTTLARIQVPRTGGDLASVPTLRTDALVFAGGAVVDALRKQVSSLAAADGLAYRGRSRRVDPLLGEIPFWFGPVEAARTQESADVD